MGWLSTLGKFGLGIGSAVAAPFTAGTSLSWLPAVLGGAGAVVGGIGQAGKQGRTTREEEQRRTGTRTEEATGTTTRRGATTIDQLQEQLETPEAAGFRRGLFPMFQREFQRAEQPVFGEAQKGAFMSNLNELAAAGSENLKQQLASSGALDSGRLAGGLTNIEMGRAGQAGQFFAGLPFLENQARATRLNDLFSGATNFLASGPRSTRTTGGTTFDETQEEARRGTAIETGTTTGTTNTTEFGPSAGRNIMTNLGGLLLGGAGRMWPTGTPNISGIAGNIQDYPTSLPGFGLPGFGSARPRNTSTTRRM